MYYILLQVIKSGKLKCKHKLPFALALYAMVHQLDRTKVSDDALSNVLFRLCIDRDAV